MAAADLSQQNIAPEDRAPPRRALHRWRVTWLRYCRLALLSAGATVLSEPALAAATDIAISMAAPPATPRILGPTVLGSLPGSPFLYTIPATGQEPLKYAATDLPSGLTIDGTSGTIAGTTPVAGSYAIDVTVTNSSGSASATLTLTAGSTLALTPPMGWNSYDSFIASVTQKDVETQAQALKTLLQPYGWNTIVIDYLWYDPEDTIDANGRWLPSKTKYPSAIGNDGFKTLAGEVHALGLQFGIHLMRGIPRKSVTANSPIANSAYTASQAGNTSDTCSWDNHMFGVNADSAAGKAWYDSIYQQYADWGVDFVKVDDMYADSGLHSPEVQAVHNSIAKTGRSTILSLSPGPIQPKDVAVLNASANMWRQVNDFWDTNGLSSISDEFTAALNWSTTNGITPGHWPDADMLPLGTIGSRPCAFSHNQQVQVMTLWSIMPSPLIFGGMPSKLANDGWTLALLTNEEVLAINQDALGARGKQIATSGSTEVWAKDLSGGRKAVALFNRGTQDATVSVTFSQLGITGTPTVRDCWHRADVTGMTTAISVDVPHDSALMYTLGGAGGTSGTGGTSGMGGASGAGGAGGGSGSGGTTGGSAGGAAGRGGGGATGNGGAVGSGGAAGGSPATGVTGSRGSTGRGGDAAGATNAGGNGGASSNGDAAGPGGAPVGGAAGGMMASGGSSKTSGAGGTTGGGSGKAAGSDAGCSCALGSRGSSSGYWILVFAAATLAARARRRRTR